MAQMLYATKLSETDIGVLKRLIYEINGYDVLIRTFTVADAEFTLDEVKWRELLDSRNHLRQVKEEIIAKLCAREGQPFTGEYQIDLGAGICAGGDKVRKDYIYPETPEFQNDYANMYPEAAIKLAQYPRKDERFSMATKNVTIVVTEDCTLRCSYCFAAGTPIRMADGTEKPIEHAI